MISPIFAISTQNLPRGSREDGHFTSTESLDQRSEAGKACNRSFDTEENIDTRNSGKIMQVGNVRSEIDVFGEAHHVAQ